jgi:hypothetical protein
MTVFINSFWITNIIAMLIVNLQDKILILYHSYYIGIHNFEKLKSQKFNFLSLNRDLQIQPID